MNFKFGRNPARFTYESMLRSHIISKHFEGLGPVPSQSPDWVSAVTKKSPGSWLMDGNDQYGDCVIADCAHQEMLRSANVGSIWIPSIQYVLALYAYFQGMQIDPNTSLTTSEIAAVTNYLANNDNGCDELTVIDYLTKTGWWGRKLDGHANLNPANLDQIKWTVNIFGASRLGINLPNSTMNQFAAGKPWDYVANDTLAGGHDVPVVKYDKDGTLWVVTWGKLQAVTPKFMAGKYSDGTPYIEEAHAELAFDWVNTVGTSPSKLNLKQLLADLNEVSAAPTPTPTPPVNTSKTELALLLTNEIISNVANSNVTQPEMKTNVQGILNAN